jgi:hypothetical protein
MAERLQAQWTAVFVEVPGQVSEDARDAVVRAFRLAEELGGETVTLSGARVADEILAWAQERNVTRLILGRPQRQGLAVGPPGRRHHSQARLCARQKRSVARMPLLRLGQGILCQAFCLLRPIAVEKEERQGNLARQRIRVRSA